MMFTKRLREPVMRGEVTCSVRIWQRPHVKVGGRYPLGGVAPGTIEVTGIREITLDHITPELARRSGFAGVVDLLKIAKHGSGERVFLVDFVYRPPADAARKRAAPVKDKATPPLRRPKRRTAR
jgi:hypothetical protein